MAYFVKVPGGYREQMDENGTLGSVLYPTIPSQSSGSQQTYKVSATTGGMVMPGSDLQDLISKSTWNQIQALINSWQGVAPDEAISDVSGGGRRPGNEPSPIKLPNGDIVSFQVNHGAAAQPDVGVAGTPDTLTPILTRGGNSYYIGPDGQGGVKILGALPGSSIGDFLKGVAPVLLTAAGANIIGPMTAGEAGAAGATGAGAEGSLGTGLTLGSSGAGLQLPAELGGTAIGTGFDSAAAGTGFASGLSASAPALGAALTPVASGLSPSGVSAGLETAAGAGLGAAGAAGAGIAGSATAAGTTAAATSALGKLLSGETMTVDDWLKLAGTVGSTALGVIGSKQQADALSSLADKQIAAEQARYEDLKATAQKYFDTISSNEAARYADRVQPLRL